MIMIQYRYFLGDPERASETQGILANITHKVY
jgi:hypothetical protein